jgi:MoaA/NifB/PqqE/SkfB family radical SAM enzyme
MNALRYLPFAMKPFGGSGVPVHLTLFVTGACNLRCRHCFHFKEVADSVPGPELEQVRALADSCARLGPLLWVSFGGGEPFLRRDLADLAQAFARHGLRHLAIPTNGLVERMEATVRSILAACPETYLSVAVSFDGPPDVHDSIRQVRGGHERSKQAVLRLRGIARETERLGVGVITTVTRENQEVLAAHVDELVRELRPDNLTINLARGTALDTSLLEVDPSRYREVVEAKRKLMREGVLPYFRYPLAKLASARDDLMYEHIERHARGEREPHLPCTAGTLSAVVFEDGSVRPCEILPDTLGNLNDVGWRLDELWNSETAQALRRRIREQRCACTWECAQADNVLFNARSWPKLALRTLQR